MLTKKNYSVPKDATKCVFDQVLILLQFGESDYLCYIFIAKGLANCVKFATAKNPCFSCLSLFHESSICLVRSSPRLPNSKKNHDALLCTSSKGKLSDKTVKDGSKTVNLSASHSSASTKLRLHFLTIVNSSNFGEDKELNAMFNCGSESSLISTEAFNFLDLNSVDVISKCFLLIVVVQI